MLDWLGNFVLWGFLCFLLVGVAIMQYYGRQLFRINLECEYKVSCVLIAVGLGTGTVYFWPHGELFAALLQGLAAVVMLYRAIWTGNIYDRP